MYRPLAKRALLLLLLGPPVAALLFAMGACGGGYEQRQEEDPKPRPLPEVRQALRPGEYSSEEFEPSLSFRVGEGWSTSSSPPETSDELALSWEASGGLGFTKVREVYEPTTGTPNVVDAPEDPVLWFERHRYLQTDESRPATVGGADGVRFDVAVEDLPEDHRGGCGPDCVATFRTTGGSALGIPEGGLQRVIVLEDVEGETVIVVFGTRATRFDEFAPEAQKVLDTVEWTGE